MANTARSTRFERDMEETPEGLAAAASTREAAKRKRADGAPEEEHVEAPPAKKLVQSAALLRHEVVTPRGQVQQPDSSSSLDPELHGASLFECLQSTCLSSCIAAAASDCITVAAQVLCRSRNGVGAWRRITPSPWTRSRAPLSRAWCVHGGLDPARTPFRAYPYSFLCRYSSLCTHSAIHGHGVTTMASRLTYLCVAVAPGAEGVRARRSTHLSGQNSSGRVRIRLCMRTIAWQHQSPRYFAHTLHVCCRYAIAMSFREKQRVIYTSPLKVRRKAVGPNPSLR